MRAILALVLVVLAGCISQPDADGMPGTATVEPSLPSASTETWYFHGDDSSDFIRPMDRSASGHQPTMGGPITPDETYVIYVSNESTAAFPAGAHAEVILFVAVAHPMATRIFASLESGGTRVGSGAADGVVLLTQLGWPLGSDYDEVRIPFDVAPLLAGPVLTLRITFETPPAALGIGQGDEAASRLVLTPV
jgi:hypothetical protein